MPRGGVAKTSHEAEEIATRIGFPLVMKPQVTVGGRAKAGAIITVEGPEDVEQSFASVKRKILSGSVTYAVLLEQFIRHDKELYLSITLDRGRRSFVLIASLEGGVDVERIGRKVVKEIGLDNLTTEDAVALCDELNMSGIAADAFADLMVKASKASSAVEAELLEINPVALISDGRMIALDAKVIIDDNALFRHPELSPTDLGDELAKIASEQGFSFVELEGSIAVIGNGAGLVLSTLDLVEESGGKAACFLDLGGGASTERVASALDVADKFERAEKILLNIFGGITKCTDVAEGIRRASDQGHLRKSLYARLSGSGEEEARRMLRGLPVKIFESAEEAVTSLIHGES